MTKIVKVYRPRVLFVTYIVPWNPRYGGALRCFGVIRGLAERCELAVVLAADNVHSKEAFLTWPALDNLSRYVLQPNAGWEDTDDGAASRRMRTIIGRAKYRMALHQLANVLQPDLIWYFEVESLHRTGLLNHVFPTVLDHCDVRWRKQLRLAQLETGLRRTIAMVKAGLLRVDDARLTVRTQHSLVASSEEIDLLWPGRTISVLPNGFDFPKTPPPTPSNSDRLLFYGSLFYKPNADGIRWLCQEVWPLIRMRRPNTQLDIVGLGHDALTDIGDTPGITFHGFVDDLEDMIRQSAALVVPLRVAGGTRIKIIEAWAKGLPVVSTTVGAEGLEAQDGKSLLLADSPEIFADRCLSLLSDLELRQRLVTTGYEHGRSRFDWMTIGLEIDKVLMQATTM